MMVGFYLFGLWVIGPNLWQARLLASPEHNPPSHPFKAFKAMTSNDDEQKGDVELVVLETI